MSTMTGTNRPKPRERVLVVEDESYVRDSLCELLRSWGYDVDSEGTAEAALELLARAPVDLVLTDLRLPGPDGLQLVRRVRQSFPELPVIVLTGYGTVASAVECLKAGANDYVLKPADPDALAASVAKALNARALQREVSYLRGEGTGAGDTGGEDLPVGRSEPWQKALRLVQAAAPTDSTVLLTGESGTGKELLARLIHRWSTRSAGPFVRVNCAAIPLDMWESEFFGHRKGAFTGATADREGRFRLAHRGTLFMDEVGAMPTPGQAKILRVLQDGEFDRLGDARPTRVDVRVVAATNADLDADAAAGRFRQDLFYRLNVVRIHLPPLRERPEDVPLLASVFAAEIAARLGRPVPELDGGTLARLRAYWWPGNVRELRNVLERAMILSPPGTLAGLDLPAEGMAAAAGTAIGAAGSGPFPGAGSGPGRAGAGVSAGAGGFGDAERAGAGDGGPDLNIRSVLATREREILLEALRRSNGLRKEAARLLGIDQRNLAYYLRKHGIDPDASE